MPVEAGRFIFRNDQPRLLPNRGAREMRQVGKPLANRNQPESVRRASLRCVLTGHSACAAFHRPAPEDAATLSRRRGFPHCRGSRSVFHPKAGRRGECDCARKGSRMPGILRRDWRPAPRWPDRFRCRLGSPENIQCRSQGFHGRERFSSQSRLLRPIR